jgi:hypothetical protein
VGVVQNCNGCSDIADVGTVLHNFFKGDLEVRLGAKGSKPVTHERWYKFGYEL